MPRRGKGGRDSCRRRRLMRGRVLIFELPRVCTAPPKCAPVRLPCVKGRFPLSGGNAPKGQRGWGCCRRRRLKDCAVGICKFACTIGDLVESTRCAVGAGFYPARAGKTGGFAFVSAHSYHVAGDLCIRDCAPPGGVEPLPYATGENFTDSHWYVLIYNAPLHNPSVTASPCHLPLHKGGFGWCKRVTSQNVQPFSSSGASRHLPLKWKALVHCITS